MDEISDHAKVLTLSDDLERTVEERVNILFDFVKVKKIFILEHLNILISKINFNSALDFCCYSKLGTWEITLS